MAFDAASLLAIDLTPWQRNGLFFLLGSYTVAALSDMRRMSAQREFFEVWLLATFVFLLLDLAAHDWMFTIEAAAKWALILLFAVLSTHRVGFLFRLARADVAAVTAAAGLMPPLLIVVFVVVLKAASLLLGPVLRRKGGAYPFMPVIVVASVLVLSFGALVERVI